MRTNAMSKGVKVRCDMARAMMMKPVQIVTVMIAAAMPMVRFENCIDVIIG